MKLAFLATLIVSLPSFAQVDSLIKIHDGTIARCESKADVYRYRLSSVYRPVEVKMTKDQTDLKLEFLKCTQDNNRFGFVRDHGIGQRHILPDEFSQREVTMTKENFSVIAYTDKGELIDRELLKANQDGTYSALITHSGRQSLKIAVQYKFKLIDIHTQEVIDQGLQALGSYRLIIK